MNKVLSAKYDTLVNDAPELIKTLPWGPDFEVDVFRKPDFTGNWISFSVLSGGEFLRLRFLISFGSCQLRYWRHPCRYQCEQFS